jgi:hypothetical protein
MVASDSLVLCRRDGRVQHLPHPPIPRSDPNTRPVTPAIQLTDQKLGSNHHLYIHTLFPRLRPTKQAKMSSQPTTLTQIHPQIHQITLSSPPDNRLTPEFLKSLSDNLDAVELEWRERGGGMSPPDPSKKDMKVEGGAVIITGIDRFFSNGLDYVKANQNKRFFEGESLPLVGKS